MEETHAGINHLSSLTADVNPQKDSINYVGPREELCTENGCVYNNQNILHNVRNSFSKPLTTCSYCLDV